MRSVNGWRCLFESSKSIGWISVLRNGLIGWLMSLIHSKISRYNIRELRITVVVCLTIIIFQHDIQFPRLDHTSTSSMEGKKIFLENFEFRERSACSTLHYLYVTYVWSWSWIDISLIPPFRYLSPCIAIEFVIRFAIREQDKNSENVMCLLWNT